MPTQKHTRYGVTMAVHACPWPNHTHTHIPTRKKHSTCYWNHGPNLSCAHRSELPPVGLSQPPPPPPPPPPPTTPPPALPHPPHTHARTIGTNKIISHTMRKPSCGEKLHAPHTRRCSPRSPSPTSGDMLCAPGDLRWRCVWANARRGLVLALALLLLRRLPAEGSLLVPPPPTPAMLVAPPPALLLLLLLLFMLWNRAEREPARPSQSTTGFRVSTTDRSSTPSSGGATPDARRDIIGRATPHTWQGQTRYRKDGTRPGEHHATAVLVAPTAAQRAAQLLVLCALCMLSAQKKITSRWIHYV